MPKFPTATVTLLFIEREGSTRLSQQLEEHYADVLANCRHLLRGIFQQYTGHEVATQGNAFFVALSIRKATNSVA